MITICNNNCNAVLVENYLFTPANYTYRMPFQYVRTNRQNSIDRFLLLTRLTILASIVFKPPLPLIQSQAEGKMPAAECFANRSSRSLQLAYLYLYVMFAFVHLNTRWLAYFNNPCCNDHSTWPSAPANTCTSGLLPRPIRLSEPALFLGLAQKANMQVSSKRGFGTKPFPFRFLFRMPTPEHRYIFLRVLVGITLSVLSLIGW